MLLALAAIPPLFAFWSVVRLGVDLPFGDDWLYVPLLEKWHSGTVRPVDLWAPYNGHRLLVLHLFTLGLADISGFNRIVDMVVGLGFRVPTLLVVSHLLGETFRGRPLLRGGLTVVASILLFSAVGFQSWFEGISSLGWNLTGLGLVTVVWAVTRSPLGWVKLSLAMAATMLTLCTLATGLLLPFVGFAGISARRLTGEHVPLVKLLAWLAFGGTALALYLHGLPPRPEGGLGFLLADFGSVTRYVLAYLGAPLVFGTTHRLPAALALAGSLALGLAIASMVGRRESLDRMLPWLLLVLFAVGNGLVTALARLPILPSVDTVIQSNRYTTVSSFFWISTIVVVALAIESAGPPQRGPSLGARSAGFATLASILALVGIANQRAYGQFLPTSSALSAGRVCLSAFRTSSDEMLTLVHPRPEAVRELAPTLERLGLGPFREDVGLLLGEAEVGGIEDACGPAGPDAPGATFVAACDNLARIDVAARSTAAPPGAVLEISDPSRPQGAAALGRTSLSGGSRNDEWVSMRFGPVPASRGRVFRVVAGREGGPSEDPDVCLRNRPASGGDSRLIVRQACMLPAKGHAIARLSGPVGPVRETRLFIDGQVRPVIAAHPPTRLSWALLTPRSTSVMMRTALALDPGVWSKPECDGVTFRIGLQEAGSPPTVLFQRHIDPSHAAAERRWIPVSVDLSTYSGKSITLQLETDAGPGANASFDWAAWELPVLTTAP